MNEMFKRDYYAFYGEEWKWGGVKRLISNRDLRYVYLLQRIMSSTLPASSKDDLMGV